jgi:hypothetical protein
MTLDKHYFYSKFSAEALPSGSPARPDRRPARLSTFTMPPLKGKSVLSRVVPR